ncbi:hypothetical protein Rsub_11922 [Raphidocelis subcapitata]|uniref:Uncharacterized protein n=1 Tax=Raphidocelis subcapitata TaxID=307507 RepID=A0A2V0PI69_9CHLO|nr:hypothetical protein Rsub_11922 [Raphidocelis subcapitata]|eukprot:GBF99436.1 hypothetical protein Rsub_11922 [Raphidocelis subcapitata]
MAAARGVQLQLRVRPLIKAAATSSLLMAVGDCARQCVQQRVQQGQTRQMDWQSVARFAAIKKSAVGQLTLFPTYTSAFFLAMGALEGLDFSASTAKLAAAFPTAAVTGTLFWPAANLVTFSLAPERRMAFLGLANIAWSSFLSMVNSRDGEPASKSPQV